LGETVSSAALDEILRANLLAECMEAFVEEVPRECDVVRESWEAQNHRPAPPEGCEREFVFNSKSKGWHYGFLGSKKDSNVWHVWSVFALDPVEGSSDLYRVVARLDSPAFQLFCRRRNRGPLAKARLETSQRISAVHCKCIYPDSTPEEIASAVPTVAPLEASVFKKTPRKRASIDTTAGSSASSSSPSGPPSTSPRSIKRFRSLLSDEQERSTSSAINAIVQAADQAEEDKRYEMVLDLVHRVQLPVPNGSTGSGSLAAHARRTTHSALVLVQGQDASEFGQLVLKLAKHWRRMDQRGLPPPVQQSQQLALSAPSDDLAPPFASFLLSQADFADHVMSLAQWSETHNEPLQVQALRAAERMLWLMQRQVLAVQRLRGEMRMMSGPHTWPSVLQSAAPTSPIPSGTPFGAMAMQQDLLPSSPLLGFPGLPMTPYLMNIHRRRMGSNTSTGSYPSMMMTDFDLEWFSKSLDTLHPDANAQTL